MRIASVQLWKPNSQHDAEAGDYCGCYWITEDEGEDSDVDTALAAANCGRGRMEDGTIIRAFFTADEIETVVADAERVTGCEAEVVWQ